MNAPTTTTLTTHLKRVKKAALALLVNLFKSLEYCPEYVQHVVHSKVVCLTMDLEGVLKRHATI